MVGWLSARRLLARELSVEWGMGGWGKVEEPQCKGVRERQRVSVASRENAKWDPRDPDDSRNLA